MCCPAGTGPSPAALRSRIAILTGVVNNLSIGKTDRNKAANERHALSIQLARLR